MSSLSSIHQHILPYKTLIYLFPSLLLSSPFYSFPLLVATQIRGHVAGSSPPLPTTVRALHSYREKISALSSSVDSRRIVPAYTTRSQQLMLFFCKKWQDSTSRTNTIDINTDSSIRGLPLGHRGDRLALYQVSYIQLNPNGAVFLRPSLLTFSCCALWRARWAS